MRDALYTVSRAVLPLLVLLVGGVLMVALPDRGQELTADGSHMPVEKTTSAAAADTVLRVGAPEPVRQATVISPYGPGFEVELVASFCAHTARIPQWISVPDKESGFAMLMRGEIDVLVGFWGDGPAQDRTAMPVGQHIVGGKAYAHFKPVRVSGPVMVRTADEASGMDGDALPALLAGDAEDMGEEVPSPVFSLVTDGSGEAEDIVLMDPASSALWLPFMGKVKARQGRRSIPYRWFWKHATSALTAQLDAFWADPARDDELGNLTERYFGFLPATLRQQEVRELAATLVERLPEFAPYILQASRETGVPGLLLVAAIYQESRFDPDAVSKTRVRGIMQLTTATAHMLNVDRKDPEQCILGGARYLRDLFNRIGDKAAGEWDRWFMALAAYNQGMSNLNRTIRIAKELGRKGDRWADIKTAFPLNTACRGVEARSFVERVRYYNFILHGLVALAPAETQDFAPLLGLAVADAAS